MTDPIIGAPSNNASQLSPPTLHWGTVGPDGDKCDLCPATIKPSGDCFISIRRAFELRHGRMVETAPLTVLMCVDCGWTRPYSPTPRASEASKVDPEPITPPDGALQEEP